MAEQLGVDKASITPESEIIKDLGADSLDVVEMLLATVHELRTFRCTARFRKGRRTRDQIANIRWITEKAREFQTNISFCFIDKLKPLTVWIITN